MKQREAWRPLGRILSSSLAAWVGATLACSSGGPPSEPASGEAGGATNETTTSTTSVTNGSPATTGSTETVMSTSANTSSGTTSAVANGSGGAGTTTSASTTVGGQTAEGAGGSASTTGEAGSAGSTSSAGGAGGSGGSDSDAVVLFDGTSFDEWQPVSGNGSVAWELPGDGTMVVVPETGDIVTRQTFEDVFVHVEYKTPELAPSVMGQDRGNSGVYLNSMYELQVLDSFGLPPAIDGCGAIYGVSAPLETACLEQEVWNTYEIEFQVARFDPQGQKLSNARVVSALLNGVLVQDDVEVPDSTQSGQPEAPGPGPLLLQDHLNRVAFRNIWVIPR